METTESESNVEMERSIQVPTMEEEPELTGGSQSRINSRRRLSVEETFYEGYINNK